MAFIRWDLEKATTSLVVADADGSHERELTARHTPAAFQPMFSRNGQGIQRPSWSMDGTSIALIGTGPSGGRHIVIVNVARQTERVILVEGGSVRSLAWLDGKTLLFNRPSEDGGMQLWRMSYPEGSLWRATFDDLTAINGGLSVTSDGTQVVTAVRTPTAGLWVGDGRGTEGKEYVAPALGLGQGWPGRLSLTWAGGKLVYPISGDKPSIASVELERESLEELIANASSPASSSDGRTIVYISPTSGLWKADADGRHAVQLVPGNVSTPIVTPDNRQVIFVSNRGNQFSIWTVPLAGGTPRQLVAGPASVPAVSPDGKLLMYGMVDDQNPKGVMAICDLPACAASRYVTPVPPVAVNFLRWMPDGMGFAYINQPNIWVQPLDGGPPNPVTHFTDGSISEFAWSHDGKRLAIARLLGVSTNIVLFKRN